jgi:nucleotide-binding universal stress UspA family protein
VSEVSTLICYDGSPSAQRALSVAASALDAAPAVLLHVWNPPQRVLADSFGVSADHTALNTQKLEDFVQRRAAEVVADGEALAGRLGFSVTSRQEVNRSSVWQTILDVANEVDATLIVTGTHGNTAVQSGLLGSVSNALVHHARRPVLLVPTPAPDVV